jgi:hypothetical protein
LADHRRRPIRAHGLVRLPGLRWLGAGAGWGTIVWLAVGIPVLGSVRLVPRLVAHGNYTAVAVIGAIQLVVWVPYLLAMASRPRIRLPGDVRQWRWVEKIVAELRRVLPRRLPAGRELVRDVERARWEIALLLRDEVTIGRALGETEHARYGLDPESPERIDLEQRYAALRTRAQELDRQIAQRVASLERLATTVRSINDGIPRSDRRRRRRRARLAGEHADAALAAAARWHDAADPGARAAERADAYATAYRELSERRPGEAGWLA